MEGNGITMSYYAIVNDSPVYHDTPNCPTLAQTDNAVELDDINDVPDDKYLCGMCASFHRRSSLSE